MRGSKRGFARCGSRIRVAIKKWNGRERREGGEGWAKKLALGLVKFVTVVAYCFCLKILATWCPLF